MTPKVLPAWLRSSCVICRCLSNGDLRHPAESVHACFGEEACIEPTLSLIETTYSSLAAQSRGLRTEARFTFLQCTGLLLYR